MNYRRLGKTNLQVSEVGFGGEHIDGTPYENVDRVINTAIDAGVNIIDIFMSAPTIRSDMGRAIGARRKDVYLQGHVGAVFENNQYLRSTEVSKCDRYIKDFLLRLNTDYIDLGMMHFIDTQKQYENAFETGYIDYVLKLKKEGVIRFIGASSHDPFIAAKVVESGVVDMIMFSINPAFDMLPGGVSVDDMFDDKTYTAGRYEIDPARARLYRLCEERDIGITVMKTLAAGRLLNEEASPFGMALTPVQCMHYALTRPAVASVLIGARTQEEMREALAYETATDAQKDYTVISAGTGWSVKGKCMYCNHCLPCPAGIDIAAVTKYLDMQKETNAPVPSSISEHYGALAATAEHCIECRSCESNCPFGVCVTENMRMAKEVFGR